MSDRYFIPAAMPRNIPTSCVIVKRPSFSYRNKVRDGVGGKGGREGGRLIEQAGKPKRKIDSVETDDKEEKRR